MTAADRLPHVAIGIDLGSSHVAVTGAHIRTPVCPIPTLHIGADETQDAFNARVVAEVARAVTETRCGRVVVEWGPFYCRPGPHESPQAFARRAAAMQRNRDVTTMQLGGVERVCADAGVPLTKIPAATWRRLIGVVVPAEVTGRERKATIDAAVKEALERHLGDAASVLRDVHQRDAFGALLGALMAPERVAAPKGKRTRGELSRDAKAHALEWQREYGRRKANEKRIARGEAPKVYRDGKHPSVEAWERLCAEREIEP